MKYETSNRIGPQAAAAIAGVTAVALGCSSAESLVDSFIEDNVTLEDTIGQADNVNLEVDAASSSPLAGQQILFFFTNDNEVRAQVPAVSSEESVEQASINSDFGLNSSTIIATTTFTNGPLAGHFLEARVDFETSSLDGTSRVTLSFNGEVVATEQDDF